MAVMLTLLQETVICYARIAPCIIVLTYFLGIQNNDYRILKSYNGLIFVMYKWCPWRMGLCSL